MTDELVPVDKVDEIYSQAEQIFIEHIENNVPVKDLARKYNLSQKTVYNRINLIREEFYKQVEAVGEKLRIDILQKYKVAEMELWVRWQENRDPAIIAQWRGIMSDIRKMFSLDKPAKANVDAKGNTVPDTLVMVFNDEAYKKKEEEAENEVRRLKAEGKIIEGESTEVQ